MYNTDGQTTIMKAVFNNKLYNVKLLVHCVTVNKCYTFKCKDAKLFRDSFISYKYTHMILTTMLDIIPDNQHSRSTCTLYW